MQDSARATTTRPVLQQAVADRLGEVAAAPGSATAESFICVSCDRWLPADRIAFDTDPEHYLGVCITCEADVIEAQERPAPWVGREVA